MKQVPDENILLFKSCLVSVEYPGIESSTKFVFDKIGIDYDISDKQTCCTGLGHYSDVFDQFTTTAIGARNFKVASNLNRPNLVMMCATCYAINKKVANILNKKELYIVMDRSDLGSRMKNYENVSKTSLMNRIPVAIRIDGKAFHTFTRGFQKPFDPVLMDAMQRTMKYLCENIQGCIFGYTQSDEITLILSINYQQLTSDTWFDYEVQKMVSVSASMATMAFNKYFSENVVEYNLTHDPLVEENKKIIEKYVHAAEKGAMFDARCFNIPKEEVTNLIYWRQLDATRNSIQAVGQAHFSHAQLQGKTCNDIQDMLITQCGINWNGFTIPCKRGTACIKTEENETIKEPNVYFGEQIGETIVVRRKWKIDYEIPVFIGAGRDYIDKLVFVEPTV